MEKWFKTLSIKELSTWIKNFDNSTHNQFLDNQPSEEDIKTAKKRKTQAKRSAAIKKHSVFHYETVKWAGNKKKKVHLHPPHPTKTENFFIKEKNPF